MAVAGTEGEQSAMGSKRKIKGPLAAKKKTNRAKRRSAKKARVVESEKTSAASIKAETARRAKPSDD